MEIRMERVPGAKIIRKNRKRHGLVLTACAFLRAKNRKRNVHFVGFPPERGMRPSLRITLLATCGRKLRDQPKETEQNIIIKTKVCLRYGVSIPLFFAKPAENLPWNFRRALITRGLLWKISGEWKTVFIKLPRQRIRYHNWCRMPLPRKELYKMNHKIESKRKHKSRSPPCASNWYTFALTMHTWYECVCEIRKLFSERE